jgi:hypothetical protein
MQENCCSHRALAIRRSRCAVGETSTVLRKRRRQPAHIAHVDQTHAATIARVHRHLPEAEAAERIKHRFQIINLWRPINHPAFDMPLAMCDYRSVRVDQDLIPHRLIHTNREGETFVVLSNPNHQWKYMSGLRPNEYILIKWWGSFPCFFSTRVLRHESSVAILGRTSPA